MNTDAEQVANELPIACSLPEQELARRREELAGDIFKNIQQVQELVDGYALRFPGDKDWATKLLDFIMFERECCRFFTFELVFEANQGPTWLRLRGGEGVKELIKEDIGL